MPRAVRINPTPNPTGLTMAERQLAIAVIQSIRASVVKAREEQSAQSYWRPEWTVEDERRALDRVCRAAMNQLAGRQKTEKGIFSLSYDGEVKDEDLEYVRASLGMGSA